MENNSTTSTTSNNPTTTNVNNDSNKVDGKETRNLPDISKPNNYLAPNVPSLSQERERIVSDVLDLYSCKPSKEKFKHYSDDVM